MKIGIYSGQIPPPIFIDQMVRGLAENNHTVYLYGTLRGDIGHYKNLSIKTRFFPKSRIRIVLLIFWLSFKLLFKKQYPIYDLFKAILQNSINFKQFLIRCNKVILPFCDNLDVLHFQWAKTLVYYPEFIEKLKCPRALSLRGTHINVSPIADENLAALYRKYFPRVSGFHAVSKAIAIEANKYGADIQKITIINPAINEKLLDIVPYNKELVKFDKLKIISIGRCHWIKGYTSVLDAMDIMKKQGVKFHYTIIASGRDDENLQYQIHDLGLNEFVTFINGLPHKQVIEKLSESNLLLHPSVGEGISNVVLEAMALRIPVVSTDCGGMTEVFDNNKNGFFVPARDIEAMTLMIKNFIKMDKRRKIKIINNAQNRIREQFLLNKQIKSMISFYHNLVQSS